MRAQKLAAKLLESEEEVNPEDLVYATREPSDLEKILANASPEFVDAVNCRLDYKDETVHGCLAWPTHQNGRHWYLDNYAVRYSVENGIVTLHLLHTREEDDFDDEISRAEVGSKSYQELKKDYSYANYYADLAGYFEYVIRTQTDPLNYLQDVSAAPARLERIQRKRQDPKYADTPIWIA